ncbi:MAG: hypothetical protein ABR520_08665 [Mycobacteriales bacterium]|nr:hypothetical protein [Frankia sp.]
MTDAGPQDEPDRLIPARPAGDRPGWRRKGAPLDPPMPAASGRTAESGGDDADLERGRTAALISWLGRAQLSLDMLDRRVARLEETVSRRLDRIESLVSQPRSPTPPERSSQ